MKEKEQQKDQLRVEAEKYLIEQGYASLSVKGDFCLDEYIQVDHLSDFTYTQLQQKRTQDHKIVDLCSGCKNVEKKTGPYTCSCGQHKYLSYLEAFEEIRDLTAENKRLRDFTGDQTTELTEAKKEVERLKINVSDDLALIFNDIEHEDYDTATGRIEHLFKKLKSLTQDKTE